MEEDPDLFGEYDGENIKQPILFNYEYNYF